MVWATFVMSGYLASRDRHIAIHVVDYVLKGRARRGQAVGQRHRVRDLPRPRVRHHPALADDVGQVTPAAEIPLLLVNSIPIIGFSLTALRAALAVAVIDLPATSDDRPEGAA